MKKHSKYYPWFIVGGSVITAGVAMSCALTLASLFVVPITQDFGIGRAEYAINTSIVSICGCIAQFTVGKLYTNHKIKGIQSGALALLGIIFILRSLTQNIVQQYICSFVAGFLTAPVMVGNSTMVTRWFQKKRGIAISIVFAGQSLIGALMSPIISNIISASGTGWRQAYLVMGFLVLIVALPIALFVMKERPSDIGMEPYGAEAASPTPDVKKAPPPTAADYSISEALHKPFFYLFFLAGICAGLFSANGAMSQIVPYLTDVYSAEMAATYISAGSIVAIGTKLLFGWINDKFGARASTAIGYAGSALLFLCLLFAGNTLMFWLIVIFYSFATSVGTVSLTLLTSETFGVKNFSLFYGTLQSITFVGGAIGGYLTAIVFDYTNSYSPTWTACVVLSLLAMVLYYTAGKLSQRDRLSTQRSV